MKVWNIIFVILVTLGCGAMIYADCIKKDDRTVTCTEVVDHDKATIERVIKDFDARIAQIDAERTRLIAESQPFRDLLAQLK